MPVANFYSDKTVSLIGMPIRFFDNSSNNPTAWEWDFDNNGTVDSTEQNPLYFFSTAETYSVKLTAYRFDQWDSIVKAT